MKKKYNFENSANKELMAEILSERGHQPRAAFLSSLAAVMVAAISLTMVFGSLSTSALPVEEQEQQTNVTSVSDGDTLPPEEVIRVHTETKTETVTVYNDTPQLSETLLVSDTVSEELPAEGKSLFNQKEQIFQWQYNGEIFTFFVKDNTVYRRNETTGKTSVVFEGNNNVSLYCVTDRYLFFKANKESLDGENTYCYRADLVTGKILRLFNYRPAGLSAVYRNYEVEFVRIDGSDVIFTHYIVHEDGSYEEINDEKENYPDSENIKHYDLAKDLSYNHLELLFNDNNTISGKDENGNYYDLGINIKNLESLDYDGNSFWSCICHDKEGNKFIFVSFGTIQRHSHESFLFYIGKITANGIDGALIQMTTPHSRKISFNTAGNYLYKEIDLYYTCYDINNQYIINHLFVPVNYDKLNAATKSEPEYYPLANGENLTVTYYPYDTLHAATPDSAD